MYVSVFIYLYVYLCICMHLNVCVFMCMCLCICFYMYVFVFIYLYGLLSFVVCTCQRVNILLLFEVCWSLIKHNTIDTIQKQHLKNI